MKCLILILLMTVLTGHAEAEISVIAPLVPPGPVSAWVKSYHLHALKSRHSKDFTECRDVSGLPGAKLCLFSNRAAMQSALLRASAFIEGGDGFPAGVVYARSSKEITALTIHVGGIDLTGEDLLRFYSEVKRQCELSHGNPDICFSKYENEIFDKVILPGTANQQPFVMIATGNGETDAVTGTVSHEIMHAQYFLVPAFREVTDAYWAALTDKQRAYIKQFLFMYDQNNDFLIRNEFQAYILQYNAESGWLNSIVEKVRPALIAALAAKGLAPVQIR